MYDARKYTYKLDFVHFRVIKNATAIYLCDIPADRYRTGDPRSAYFVLLQMGFALPCITTKARTLLPHVFTLTSSLSAIGGIFSVALSVNISPPHLHSVAQRIALSYEASFLFGVQTFLFLWYL